MDDQPVITFMQRASRFLRRNFLWACIIAVIILLALVFEAGRYSVYRAHPELSDAEQAAAILKNVGQLIELPAGETPTMATINDAASAKQAQPFLAAAQNGDVLIVYQQAAEAILYRPSADKLIAVGPVQNQPTQSAGTETMTPTQLAATSTNATTTKKK